MSHSSLGNSNALHLSQLSCRRSDGTAVVNYAAGSDTKHCEYICIGTCTISSVVHSVFHIYSFIRNTTVFATLTVSNFPAIQRGVFPSPTWRFLVLNLGPSVYKTGTLPLTYSPSIDFLLSLTHQGHQHNQRYIDMEVSFVPLLL